MSDRQLSLFDDPRPNSTVHPVERPRVCRQSLAVLERLRQGPATNMDLLPISTRFGARIHELRKAGHRIEMEHIDRERGITQYTLIKGGQ